jgi:DNA repair exonuclease SbcCD nuclease subunit
MQVAIITDTHYNFKKGNKVFHEYFEKFYKEVFFPTLRKYKIDTVIHMGDMFDNRKSTDYWSIDWTKRVILEPLKKYKVHVILGNHDIFYKNTTKLNSPMLLLNDYKNIKVYDTPSTVQVGGQDIFFIPWITPESEQETLDSIRNTPARVAMGHLELSGFYVNQSTIQQHGMDKEALNKFDKVFSGHYHMRNDDGKIFYLGNPYQLYWSDYNDKRGFTIFDTDTYELTKIDNPYEMFKICYYDEDNVEEDLSSYEGCIVKLIVKNKTDHKKYEKFLDNLNKVEPYELKVIENIQINSDFDADEAVENEDTLTLLKRYVDESEIKLNKSRIKDLIQSIYKESFQLQ